MTPFINVDSKAELEKLQKQGIPLEEILNITFLATEYSTSFGGRIDTVGVDQSGAPVIIEYKRSTNESVINQGLSYLRWLLDHKAEFESLCHDKKIQIEIDWDSPRVICVAESYNKFDIDTKAHAEPLQKNYTIEGHLRKSNEATKALFMKLREAILAFDEEVSEVPKKMYIAYKLTTNFADVIFFKDGLRVTLNVKSGELYDPEQKAIDFTKPKKGHWGNGDYEIKITSDQNFNYALDLIKQSYFLNK